MRKLLLCVLLIMLFSCPVLSEAATAPTITRQPMECLAMVDETAWFDVTATGTEPLEYQWQRSNDRGATWSDINGANAANYLITSLPVNDGALFRVVVSNSYGSVTSDSARLRVSYPHPVMPQIWIYNQPAANTSVTEGNISGNLSVEANILPSGTINYQWFFNTTNSNVGGTSIAGATNASFTIPKTLTASGSPYYYYCVLRGIPIGHIMEEQVSSEVATVTVMKNSPPPEAATAPTITRQPMGGLFLVNTTAWFDVIATGTEPLEYQWQRSNDRGATWSDINGANAANYLIASLPVNDSALFRVVVSNSYGSVTSDSARLRVSYPHPPVAQILIYTQPASDISVTEGNIFGNLSVGASILPSGTINYQWFSNTTNSNDGGTFIAGATNASFTIPKTLTASGSPYYYYCLVIGIPDGNILENRVLSEVATVTVMKNSPPFVPVTSITDIQTTATAKTSFKLSGTVIPADATNTTIVWSIANAGTTGASISGNTFSAMAAGTATVRAVIENGAAETTDYTQDFVITVNDAGNTNNGGGCNNTMLGGGMFGMLMIFSDLWSKIRKL